MDKLTFEIKQVVIFALGTSKSFPYLALSHDQLTFPIARRLMEMSASCGVF